jgi:Zn-dependent M16 (insulinase) family peptidase
MPQPRFKTVQQLTVDYAPVKIAQYESTRTGMRVVVVDQKGPKVEGRFALATEINDDSGAPHTLEHLVFMGSKSYHYKGLLDRMACRAFSYTNAYTDVDHTCYELNTAGWEGFAQILPAYLEHVIVPTLTDAGCYTEVHHVDGSGNDAGVVYSEMQGVENNADEIMGRRAREMLYPVESGYRSETGGMTKELRSLTADRIRAFHREMYQPKNLRVIITGEVDHDELLRLLDEFETTIEGDVPTMQDPFTRPWVKTGSTPPLTETKIETIKFPEEDESAGEALIGFVGPDVTDEVSNSALAVLLIFLCGSSISVLENTLVEREQLCSAVYYSTDTRPDVAIWFTLSSVDTDKLRSVYERLIEVLQQTASKPLDMAYMLDCVQRSRRQIKQQAENASGFFTTPVIEDHLYGHRDGRNLAPMCTLKDLDEVEKWTESQWNTFLRRWLSDAKHVVVLGEPSKDLADRLTAEEKARVKAQQDRLGKEGLKKLAEKLKQAQEENDRPIPDELLARWPQPSTDSVHFIPTVTARSGAARDLGKLNNEIQDIIDKSDDKSPLFIHFEHIPSTFVRIQVLIGTSSLPTELKPLLPLYLSNLFTSPVTREGERVEFEKFVIQLEKDTTFYGVDSAMGNGEMLALTMSFEPQSYETAIGHLRTVLFNAIHDPVRLHASLTKILAELPEYKRDGESMLFAVSNMVQFKQSGFRHASNVLTRAVYLKRLRALLKTEEEAIVEKYTKFCHVLHRPENFRIYVATDLHHLPNPVSTWGILTREMDLSKPLEVLDSTTETLSNVGRSPGSTAYIVAMSTIDSSFGLLTAKGPDSLSHPDYPALLVAIGFLSATEGPLWVAVRGTGLAYGVSLMKSVSTGTVSFLIYRSPDPYKAFKASKEEIEGYASGKLEIGRFAMESAISEIVSSGCECDVSWKLDSANDVHYRSMEWLAKRPPWQVRPKLVSLTRSCEASVKITMPSFCLKSAR